VSEANARSQKHGGGAPCQVPEDVSEANARS
jgi:hypothetical protein